MIDWSKLDEFDLEYIAFEFASKMYSEYTWIKSPLNGDSKFHFSTEDKRLNTGIAEIDYYNSQKGIISKNKIETLFLAGFFNDDIVFTLLITNGHIPPKYMIRAEKIFRHSNKFVKFIDKDDLEHWLSENIKVYEYCLYKKNKFPVINRLLSRIRNKNSLSELVLINYVFFLEEREFIDTYLVANSISVSEFKQNITEHIYPPIKQLEINKEYIMCVSISSLIDTHINVDLGSIPFDVIEHPNYSALKNIALKKGHNNIFLLLKPTKVGEFYDVQLKFMILDNILEYNIKNLQIINTFSPKIIFDTQQKIIFEIYKIISVNRTNHSNGIISIFADGGNGKSYVLDEIKKNTKNEFDILSLDFTESNEFNCAKIASIILFANIGLFFDIDETNLNLIYEKYLIGFSPLIKRLITELRGGVNETEIIQILNHIEKSRGLFIYPSKYTNKKIIFIDDIHKLSSISARVMMSLLKDFSYKDSNCLMVIAGRKNDFLDKNLLLTLNKYSTFKHFEIFNPNIENIVSTFQLNFKEYKDVISENLISNINVNVLFLSIMLNELIKKVIINKNQFINSIKEVKNKLVENKNTFIWNKLEELNQEEINLLDIIYGCRLNISLEDLEGFNKYLSSRHNQDYAILNLELLPKLKYNDLIIESNKQYIPKHDLFYETYIVFRGNEIYQGILYDYISFHLENRSCQIEEQLYCLSLILKSRDKHNISNYLAKAYKIEKEYMAKTQYGKLLKLSETIVNLINENDPNYERIGIADVSHYMNYALCLNHCESVSKARDVFEIVCKLESYIKENDPYSKGLFYQAKSEIINIDFYTLNTLNIENDLNDLISKIEPTISKSNKLTMTAYLNAKNRLMVTNLLLDKYELAEELFKINIKLPLEYKRDEYIGYANMDFAKGIYHTDPEKALNLLEKALTYFDNTSEFRRKLDCECEINFVKQILYKDNIKALIHSSNRLKEEGLNTQYLKSLIKIASCLLMDNPHDYERVNRYIDDFIWLNNEKDYPRELLFVVNIQYALKIFKSSEYFNDFSSIDSSLNRIGNYYSNVFNHNSKISKNISDIQWYKEGSNQKPDAFLLDPRIW